MASADRRRVLFAVDWYPPAFRAGGPVRSVAQLAAALALEAEVFVVTGTHDLGSAEPLPAVAGVWQVEYGVRVLRLPPSDRSAARWTAVLEEVRPHVLHLNSLFSRDFTLAPLRASRKWAGLRRILAPRGMLAPGALAIRPLKKRLFLAWARRSPRFSGLLWHATSEQEARDIRRRFPAAPTAIAPNLAGPARPCPRRHSGGPWRVVSLGRVHPVKHLDFALDVLARAGCPVQWDIVGPWEDRAYMERLRAAADAVPHLTVQWHGGLPPDRVEAVLREAHFLVMPSLTENFGHAVVEAWAAGCPVWVSDRTPWRGLHEAGVGEVLPLEKDVWVAAVQRWLGAGTAEWEAASARCVQYRAGLDERSGAAAATRRIFSA
jgi:glycosyltransferase involved in cell wall biosynthesis